jgi:AraC-like DNA-binding protein
MIARQLLFLFSALGAINGIFLAIYFFMRRPRRLSDSMLGALLLAIGVRTAKSTFLFFDPSIAIGFRQLGLSACLLIGPLTYLYVHYHLAELQQRPADDRWRWHLAFSFLVIGIGIVFPYADYRAIWDQSSYAIHAFWFAYLLATARALWRARAQLLDPGVRATTRAWLPLSVFAGSLLILAAYVSTPLTSYIVGALSFTFLIHIAIMVFLLRKEAAGTKEKYQNRRLSEQDVRTILAALDEQMRAHGLYRNPNLTLAQLAKRTGNISADVSQVLNDKLNKSFNQYVNEFRIHDAKRLLVEEPQLNLETVAERCGFNSNSTFFAAFKKVAGQTPASYRAASLPSP